MVEEKKRIPLVRFKADLTKRISERLNVIQKCWESLCIPITRLSSAYPKPIVKERSPAHIHQGGFKLHRGLMKVATGHNNAPTYHMVKSTTGRI